MNKTLLSRGIIISITATILLTALFAATFAHVAQGISKRHVTMSNSQSTSSSNGIPATDAAPASFLTYKNATWRIKIQYPSSWVKQTSALGVTFVVLANCTNYNNNNIQQPFLAKLNVTSVPGIRINTFTQGNG